MIPKIHDYGTSFQGAAIYVLHDKDKSITDERVEWTETRNLAVNADTKRGRDLAWRIMAATSMDADRLKAEAGIKNTGRKSLDHVMHFTLAWHPDENPDREEILRATDQAIEALGAIDRQALIVAHNDEKHAHVHVVLSRVSPEDGRLLPKRLDRRKLSDWALGYELERSPDGRLLCELRRQNKRIRDRNKVMRKGKLRTPHTWAPKAKPRHILEAERVALNRLKGANDNLSPADQSRFERTEQAQRAADVSLATKGREIASRQQSEHSALVHSFDNQYRQILDNAAEQRSRSRRDIDNQFNPQFQALDNLFLRKNADTQYADFERLSEKHLELSDNYNANSSQDAERIRAEQDYIKRMNALFDRRERLRRQGALRAQERKEASLRALRARNEAEKSALALRHNLENAKLKADWKERNRSRNAALSLLSAPDVDRSFREAASADPIAKRTSGDQKTPTPDHDSARDRYIRDTSGEDTDRKLSRDEYIRKTRDQDNDRKDRDPDRER